MSLVQDIADYIEANTSLVVDETIFVGGDTVDTPSGSIIIREFVGSTENESGLEARAIQILSIDLGYINSETLNRLVYGLFANKPGFAAILNDIFFVSVVNMPGFVDRDKRGNYVFSSGFLFQKS
jgi:hypothetical protein